MILCIVLMMQCTNDDELYLNSDILQGTWVETEPENLIQYEGDNYTFTFKQDSFYLKIENWTDIVYPGESMSPVWYYYASGLYILETDTIRFSGTWCPNSNYCKSAETMYLNSYSAKFNYEMRSDNEFVLDPDYEEYGSSIRLVKQK